MKIPVCYKVLKLNYNIDYEVYSIKTLGLPIEQSNVPFLFLLNPDMTVELIFAPIKELPDLTKNYFNMLKHRFWLDE